MAPRLLFLLAICATGLTGPVAGPPAGTGRNLSVLVDTSMEFLFVYDHLAGFLRREGYTVTQNRGTLHTALLDDYDIVLIQQLTTPLRFEAQFIAGLKDWVERGGRLFIVGHGVQWRNRNRRSRESFPLNAVAEVFGFRFNERDKGRFPLRGTAHPIAKGTPTLTEDKYDPRARIWGPGWLKANGVGLIEAESAEPVFVDADGKVVMAARKTGQGRVVAFTGKRLLWGCTHESSVQHDPEIKTLVRRVFDWLREGRPSRAPRPDVVRVRHPDIEIKGKRTSIRTTEVLRGRAEYTLEQFDRVYDVLYDYFKVPAYSQLRMNALAGAGGGWRAADEIGIAVLASDEGIRSLLLWEMTNGWGPPIPDSWVEMWAVHTGQVLRGRLAIGSPAEQILTRHRKLQEAIEIDPHLNKLDLADAGDEKTHRKVLGKASYVVEQLERTYPGFISRLCRIHRAQDSWTEQVSMQEFVYLCSLAAGKDLYPYFQSLGTTVEPQKIDFARAAELLEEYEREHPDEPKLLLR
ncbi:MAG: hypothetical protein ACE5I3_00100 [Phycisphaerae bacterium]